MNRVDELQQEIKNIQDFCIPHSFEQITIPQLLESNVSGVYIASCQGGQAELKQNPNNRNCNIAFPLKCTSCSLDKKCTIIGTCPMCYGTMKKGEGLEPREKYYGIPFSYYMARLHSCEACNFRSVTEEFDQ